MSERGSDSEFQLDSEADASSSSDDDYDSDASNSDNDSEGGGGGGGSHKPKPKPKKRARRSPKPAKRTKRARPSQPLVALHLNDIRMDCGASVLSALRVAHSLRAGWSLIVPCPRGIQVWMSFPLPNAALIRPFIHRTSSHPGPHIVPPPGSPTLVHPHIPLPHPCVGSRDRSRTSTPEQERRQGRRPHVGEGRLRLRNGPRGRARSICCGGQHAHQRGWPNSQSVRLSLDLLWVTAVNLVDTGLLGAAQFGTVAQRRGLRHPEECFVGVERWVLQREMLNMDVARYGTLQVPTRWRQLATPDSHQSSRGPGRSSGFRRDPR
jgi:hypothetical protein